MPGYNLSTALSLLILMFAGKPIWVAFTLEDSTAAALRSGQGIPPAVHSILQQSANVEAVLLNCCHPEAISAALPQLAAAVGSKLWSTSNLQDRSATRHHIRIGAYANGFKTTTSAWLKSLEGSTQKRETEQESAASCLPKQPDAEGGGVGTSSSECELSVADGDYDPQGMILPDAYSRFAVHWLKLGASIVGGCCGVGPAHIASVCICLAQAGAAMHAGQSS